MKRVVLNILLACLPVVGASAQKLVIAHVDGTRTDIELSTYPCVTISSDSICVLSSEASMKWKAQDVIRFTYETSDVGIETVQNKANVVFRDGRLVFSGVTDSRSIQIFNVNGIRVPVTLMRQGDDTVLRLSDLSKGAYLITAYGRTFKFLKP